MIFNIEKEMTKCDTEIGTTLKLIEPDLQGRLTLEALEKVLLVIKDHPNDEQIKQIVLKLDSDKDGMVTLKEILEMAEKSVKKEGHGVVKNKDDDDTNCVIKK